MRRLFLLAALCMVGALTFAPVVLAQGVPPGGGEDGSVLCPEEAPIAATVAGDPGEGSLLCFATQEEADAYRATGENSTVSATAEADDESATASASAGPVSCEGFTTISGEPSQFQAQQFYDFSATEEEQAILDPDGNGFACDGGEIEFGGAEEESVSATAEADDEVSATATASASAEVEELPETGGAASPALLTVLPALLLVGSGIMAIRVVRRT